MKYWTTKEEKYLIESIENGIPYKQIAEDLDRTTSSLHSKISEIRKTTTVKRKSKVDTKEYALYKGEELLCAGTIDEIAKHQNIKRESVFYYQTPAYKRRKKGESNFRELVRL